MDQYSSKGRKLRPRRTAEGNHSNFEKVEYQPHSNYGENRNSEGEEHRSFSGSRSFGERRPYSDHRSEGRPYGERRNFGEHSNYGERRSFSGPRNYGNSAEGGSSEAQNAEGTERRSYSSEGRRGYSGERRSFGGSRNFGERRPYSSDRRGEGRPYGERRSFGGPRNYSDNAEGSSAEAQNAEGTERRTYSREGSERRSYSSEGRSGYGERRSFGGPRRDGDRRDSRRSFGDRKPGFGGRKPFNRGGRPNSSSNFTKSSFEGISRMIERRPVVNGGETEESYQTPIKDEIRLNKFIANSGVCSRREADTLIQAGVVTVNGEVVTELGTKVNIHDDDIRFNGEKLKGEEKVYLIMNKPKGYVTTASDPHADKTVIELIKGCSSRVYPVGRLDKNTTGVLLLTNDGEIAERLTHPAYDKKKIYQVALDKDVTDEDFQQILSGVTLTDGEVKADELEFIDPGDKRKIGIEIHSGKNRVVRRIFETLGYSVKALDRVYFAGLTKKGLKKGEWRYLTEGEANILKMGAYL